MYSAERICESLAPEDMDSSCIKINDYLAPSADSYPRISGKRNEPQNVSTNAVNFDLQNKCPVRAKEIRARQTKSAW